MEKLLLNYQPKQQIWLHVNPFMKICLVGKNQLTVLKPLMTCRKMRKNIYYVLKSLAGVPIDMISTGPDRNETIILRHPL